MFTYSAPPPTIRSAPDAAAYVPDAAHDAVAKLPPSVHNTMPTHNKARGNTRPHWRDHAHHSAPNTATRPHSWLHTKYSDEEQHGAMNAAAVGNTSPASTTARSGSSKIVSTWVRGSRTEVTASRNVSSANGTASNKIANDIATNHGASNTTFNGK